MPITATEPIYTFSLFCHLGLHVYDAFYLGYRTCRVYLALDDLQGLDSMALVPLSVLEDANLSTSPLAPGYWPTVLVPTSRHFNLGII